MSDKTDNDDRLAQVRQAHAAVTPALAEWRRAQDHAALGLGTRRRDNLRAPDLLDPAPLQAAREPGPVALALAQTLADAGAEAARLHAEIAALRAETTRLHTTLITDQLTADELDVLIRLLSEPATLGPLLARQGPRWLPILEKLEAQWAQRRRHP